MNRPVPAASLVGRSLHGALADPRVVLLAFVAETASYVLGMAAQLAAGALLLRALLSALGSLRPSLFVPLPLLFAQAVIHEVSAERGFVPLAGAGLAVAALVFALRLVWTSAAVRAYSQRVVGETPAPGLGPAAERLGRAAAITLMLWPVQLASFCYRSTLLVAGALVYLHALEVRAHGLAGAFGVALAIVLAVFVDAALSLLSITATVRAIAGDLGPIAALREGFDLLRARPLGLAFVAIAFAILEGFAVGVGGVGGALVPPAGAGLLLLSMAGRALTGLVGAGLLAWLSSAELLAFVTLDADLRGALPAPPEPPPVAPAPAEPILGTEAVLDTQVVLPTTPTNG